MAKEEMTNTEETSTSKPSALDILEQYEQEQKAKALEDANKLVRVRITCNNPNKTNYTSEIFCVRNDKVAEIKKAVPFGVAWHVPRMLLNMIEEKQFQKFEKKRVNGNQVTTTKLMPEYTIEYLPPLTEEEFEAIRQKQLAEGLNGETLYE